MRTISLCCCKTHLLKSELHYKSLKKIKFKWFYLLKQDDMKVLYKPEILMENFHRTIFDGMRFYFLFLKHRIIFQSGSNKTLLSSESMMECSVNLRSILECVMWLLLFPKQDVYRFSTQKKRALMTDSLFILITATNWTINMFVAVTKRLGELQPTSFLISS